MAFAAKAEGAEDRRLYHVMSYVDKIFDWFNLFSSLSETQIGLLGSGVNRVCQLLETRMGMKGRHLITRRSLVAFQSYILSS